MAGMLPGVECARRRRLHHQSGRCLDVQTKSMTAGFTRHPNFCLYSSNHESHHPSPLIKDWNSMSVQTHLDDSMDDTAKEAKERLDEKLKALTKPQMKSKNGEEGLRSEEMNLQKGRHVSKNIFSWTRLRCKISNPYQMQEPLCSQWNSCIEQSFW